MKIYFKLTSNLKPQTSNLKPQTSNLKPQTSNLKPLLFLCLMTLFFFGCEKDDSPSKDNQSITLEENVFKQRFLVKSINREELIENDMLVENLKKLKLRSKTKVQGKSHNSKDVYNATYDFSVNTDYVNYVEDSENNTHSYTFPITRQNSKDDNLENLSLVLNEEGDYDAFIVNYGLTPEQLNSLNPNESFTSETKITPIDFDVSTLDSDLFSKVTTAYIVYYYDWVYVGNTDANYSNGGSHCQNCPVWKYVLVGTDATFVHGNTNPLPNYTPGSTNPQTNSGTSGSSTGTGSPSLGTVIAAPTVSKPEAILSCAPSILAIEGAANWLNDFQNNRGGVDDLYYYISQNGCNDNTSSFVESAIEALMKLPDAKFERILELDNLLKDNPWALIEDCAQQNGLNTSNYLDLYNLPFPEECSDRLFNMGVEWHHQPITDGNVPCANIDYYGVEVTNYPDFNNDGNPDSEAEMYQAFRDKFIDLGSGELEGFQFSCDVPGNPTDTGNINWQFEPLTVQDGIDFVSNDPVASILLIEAEAEGLLPTIAADDGAVMVSDFTNNDWTISTIMTANNGTQPFSGNRQWGWLINQNGNFEFFTRAVDVANISKLLNVLSFGGANTECQQDTYYNIAEATWKNMQQEIAHWVNDHGGQVSINTPKAVRVKKETIEEILTTNESIDQILSNCN